MADPRWLDPNVDPNERTPGTCYLGDPQVVNMSPVGLARFSTLRSWLSQWSYDDAHGDGVDCGRDIAVPALVIGNLADDACEEALLDSTALRRFVGIDLGRERVPDGTKLMPHKHPEDRIYTVMSGVFYIGLGEKFDGDKVKAYPPGSVIILPGETWHFHWAKSGEYVTQVTAIGPLGLEYHDPHDDPRRHSP